MIKFLQNQRAVSIVEIILVVMIVGFIILFLSNIPSSLGLVSNSNHKSIARDIISRKIEDLRLAGYDNICNPSPTPCNEQIVDSRLSLLPGGSGQVEVGSCSVLICTNGESMKQIKVTVSWVESGKTISIETDTLIAQGGLK